MWNKHSKNGRDCQKENHLIDQKYKNYTYIQYNSKISKNRQNLKGMANLTIDEDFNTHSQLIEHLERKIEDIEDFDNIVSSRTILSVAQFTRQETTHLLKHK